MSKIDHPSVGVVLPYFGSLPSTWDVTLQSMERNGDIDWHIFTDQDVESHANVRVTQTSLAALKRRFERELGFQVALERPYKLCDFKPAYGRLFEEELASYDYWGYCDADVVFGGVQDQVADLSHSAPDKIFRRGHLSLLRNDAAMCDLFSVAVDGLLDYRTIFQDQRSFAFDEVGGMYARLEALGISIVENDALFDIAPDRFRLRANNAGARERYYVYLNGRMVALDHELRQVREGRYIHLQKRRFDPVGPRWREASVIGFAPDRLVLGQSIEGVCRDIRERERQWDCWSGWHRRYIARRFAGVKARVSAVAGPGLSRTS